VYFGLRAVAVEPTGQKSFGDRILLDSLRVITPGTIHQPANGATVLGREAVVEVRTGSDPGQTLRQLWFEDAGSGWTALLDTCLPRSECEKPFFGTVTVQDTIILSAAPTPIPTLFCVLATESGTTQGRGLKQSLGCSKFERVE
jgi:hypothetical protein